jgi:hypothetical protein
MTDQAEPPRVAGGTDGEAAAVRVLDRDGRRFAVVDADGRTTVPEFVDAAAAARSDPDTGVVVRAPGEDASAVQRLVDEVAESSNAPFEVFDTEMVETDAGYQYRSYLTARDE